MKIYQTNEIKNISLLGSKGSGKTTLAEAMLFECGVIKRRGSVEAKNTVSDYFPVEKEYGYSVFSTVFYAEFLNKKINVIDCPGADDFVGNAVTALNVTDTGVILVDAQYGVEVGTQNIFRTTASLNKPVIFAINQLDGEKADYDNTLEQMREIFGKKIVPIQYPLSCGPTLNAMIDVLLMKKYSWGPEGGVPTIEEIPAEELERAQELHQALVEAAAENDETLMEKFFEQGHLTEDEMREGIRKGLVDRSIFPVFCVSALKDMGVRRMMEFLGNVVPFVNDMPAPVDTAGDEVRPDSNGPLSIYMFKTTVEPHIGEVQYFKVMSGTLNAVADLDNITRGKERLAQIYCVCGQIKTPVDKLCAGDIGASVKLKDVRTGNTLNEKGCEIAFDFIKYPAPKYSRAIRPVTESDAEKLSVILTRMHEEDPTWEVVQSKELKQTILSGQGEFHLRTLKWRVENNDKLPIVFEEPKIPYRETITKAARADYRHKKQSGGAGQFGEVHLIIEPYYEGMPEPKNYKVPGKGDMMVNVKTKEEYDLPWGGKLQFYSAIVGGAIDARFMPAILKGIMEKMDEGPLTGSYARDIRVVVYDGKMHPVDSNEISFKLAARNAFKEAFRNAGPKIMEPIYNVEVLVPSEYMGAVMSDLQNRRSMIAGMESDKGFDRLTALVPLAELYRYSTSLSSLTSGSATYTMKFASYEQVPADVQDKLLKAYTDTDEE